MMMINGELDFGKFMEFAKGCVPTEAPLGIKDLQISSAPILIFF